MLVVHHVKVMNIGIFCKDYLIKVILNECDDPLMVTGELTEDEGFMMLINHAYSIDIVSSTH